LSATFRSTAEISPQWFLICLHTYLARSPGVAVPGRLDLLNFDVQREFPEKAADLVGGKGRIIIAPHTSRSPASIVGSIARFSFRLAIYAHSQPDCAFLSEAIASRLMELQAGSLPMPGQCLKGCITVTNTTGATFEKRSELYVSVINYDVQIGLRAENLDSAMPTAPH